MISKFQVGLKYLLCHGQSEPDLYGDLVYKLKKIVGSNNFSIMKRLAITLMYCNRLLAWWSNQSRLATLLSFLIAGRWAGLQTLRWFRLKDLSIDEMVGAWCFRCLSGQPGFTCWTSFAPIFSFIKILLLSPYLCFISLLYLALYVLRDDALIS